MKFHSLTLFFTSVFAFIKFLAKVIKRQRDNDTAAITVHVSFSMSISIALSLFCHFRAFCFPFFCLCSFFCAICCMRCECKMVWRFARWHRWRWQPESVISLLQISFCPFIFFCLFVFFSLVVLPTKFTWYLQQLWSFFFSTFYRLPNRWTKVNPLLEIICFGSCSNKQANNFWELWSQVNSGYAKCELPLNW